MIRKIVQISISKFNAVETITVPEDSYLLSAEAINDKPVLFVVQPATPKKVEGKVLTTTIEVLAIHNEDPWSDVVGEDLQLSYIGVAKCDNGYRVYHIWEIVEAEEEFNEEDFAQLVADLREETIQITPVEVPQEGLEPQIEIKEGGKEKKKILTYATK